MTTEDIIIALFCEVDDRLSDEPKHPQAHLWPSELVTIGLLFALKGVQFRPFYRWLKRDFEYLFVKLPERTRLSRQLQVHQGWTDKLLADPTFFTLVDSYGIELIHPIREGRSQAQIGRKGKSNYRWIVGLKLCWLINDKGEVVDWAWATANVHDQRFLPMIKQYEERTITLADMGFECADGLPSNLKICAKGTWNERMLIETALSMVTVVCRLKHIFHRVEAYAEMHLAYISALFNTVLRLNRTLEPDAKPEDRLLHIAQFAL